MSSSAILKDKSGNTADIDPASGGLISIESRSARIHNGEAFRAGVFNGALADDGLIEILIKTGTTQETHTRFEAAAGGDAEVNIFEGTTVSADGSGVGAGNRNRISSKTPDTTIFSGPTITGDGTLIAQILLPGGTGGNASGGNADSPVEFVLKLNTNYLIRIKNISGAIKPFSATMDWYEPGAT